MPDKSRVYNLKCCFPKLKRQLVTLAGGVIEKLVEVGDLTRAIHGAGGADVSGFRMPLRDLCVDRVSAATEAGQRTLPITLFDR